MRTPIADVTVIAAMGAKNNIVYFKINFTVHGPTRVGAFVPSLGEESKERRFGEEYDEYSLAI